MQRRDFAASTLVALGAVGALSQPARAAAGDTLENIVFTQAQPGHWKGVEALHVPTVTIDGSTLTVTTPHPMSEQHYIVSHTVVLADGTFLDRKTFAWTDQPVSKHTLPAGYKGNVQITSTCNLHDWWLKLVPV